MCRDKDKGIETNMQYIVLDLEWNQAPSREKTVTTPEMCIRDRHNFNTFLRRR